MGSQEVYGREFDGIIRTTFLGGADGTILEEWRKVKVKGHVDAVIAAAEEINHALSQIRLKIIFYLNQKVLLSLRREAVGR